MSDTPDGTAIAAIVSAGGAALGTVIGAWKGLADTAALKTRVDAIEALGLAALKLAFEGSKTWADGELRKLRGDLDLVAASRIALEKRVDAYREEIRSGKRQPTGQHVALDPAAVERALARDEAQERRLLDLEKKADSNTSKIDKLVEYINTINVALARIETHLDNMLEAKRRRGA